jgi:hypothetical protein
VTADGFDGSVLGRAGKLPEPPPASAALLEAIGRMKPVRTRSRFGGFLIVLLLGIAWPAVILIRLPMRRDLMALPGAWVAIGAALWGVSFLLPLAIALIPRRHDVLPSVGHASRVSLLAMGVLFLFTALWTADAPGVSLRPDDTGRTLLRSAAGCAGYVLQVAAVLLVAGFFAVRRVLPMGGRRVGMALGAAGGALGGLALHFHCPIATTGHVLLSHVGAMILAAAAGALIMSGLLRR